VLHTLNQKEYSRQAWDRGPTIAKKCVKYVNRLMGKVKKERKKGDYNDILITNKIGRTQKKTQEKKQKFRPTFRNKRNVIFVGNDDCSRWCEAFEMLSFTATYQTPNAEDCTFRK